MASKLTSRVEKLAAIVGASNGQKVLLISIGNWPANLPEERAKAIRASFLGEIEGHETANTIIFLATHFIYQDEGPPKLDGYAWERWGVS
jgi:hypothetical protein